MNRLLLVDGSNLLFQMFYGMPARIVNEHGKAIQGTLGFTGALLKMIRMTDPTHIAVLFDGDHNNPRSEIDAEYKADRPDYHLMPEEETPFSQLADVYAALDHLEIRYAETTDCETDDWIAAYAMHIQPDTQLIIASFDSDFFQLISPQVSVLRYRGEKSVFCTPDYLQNKFGILPSQYADLKAMTGDQADHIKGADHIGPKTASSLLKQFGTLEQILKQAGQIAKPSIHRSILDSEERLRKNLRLIKLTGSADLPFPMEELRHERITQTTMDVLKAIRLR